MGTYYGLGVAHFFEIYSNGSVNKEVWMKVLNDKLNLDLYDITFYSESIEGVLKERIFEDNVEAVFQLLKQITQDTNVDYYFREYGANRADYPYGMTYMKLKDDNGHEMLFKTELSLLFIEGKVGAEEFSFEPKIINWLFRHSNIDNPLMGCIFGDIVG